MYQDEMISEISMRCNIPVEDVAEVLEEEENIIEEERYCRKRKKKIAFTCLMATAACAACATVYVLNKKNKIDIEKTKNDIEKMMKKYIDKIEKLKNEYLPEK
ncbi:MAG: hypothetical protein IJ141_01750 [Lachnospiraceae bacterium]|nr:hypothetical protein [Lachnospiraceae bacterium]